MAAPQIPNLLSMRGGGRGGRGGREGRGGPSGLGRAQVTPAQLAERKDRLIQATDTDASVSRISAVHAGYLQDPYARDFVLGDTPKRYPIINRGTYVRTSAIDHLITAFLTAHPATRPRQIISLGAGTDTRFWRFRTLGLTTNVLYHEIDFPLISAQKLATIRSSSKLSPLESPFAVLHDVDRAGDPKVDRWGFFKDAKQTEGYLFHPIDLRKPGWKIHNLIRDAPTLLISECCLCYMSVDEASRVILEFSQLLCRLGIIIYEPTLPNDDFGKVMFQNLASRGLYMPTVTAYPTFTTQMERLKELGFSRGQNCADVEFLWKNWTTKEEKERVNGLEMLDEVEEWELLARHYLVAWAWKELPWERGNFIGWEDGSCAGILKLEKIVLAEDGDDQRPGGEAGDDEEAPVTPRPQVRKPLPTLP